MLSANDQTSGGLDPSVVGHTRVPTSKTAFTDHMETTASKGLRPEQLQHIWIITGPAGSGKTTVAQNLEKALGLPFLEGDDVSIF
jgi:gluconokinase